MYTNNSCVRLFQTPSDTHAHGLYPYLYFFSYLMGGGGGAKIYSNAYDCHKGQNNCINGSTLPNIKPPEPLIQIQNNFIEMILRMPYIRTLH